MKRLPHFLHKSLYNKLFLYFLIIILPIQLLGFYIFRKGTNALESEIKNNAASSVSLLKNNFDSEIENIDSQLNLLINTSDNAILQFYVENGTYSESQYWLALRNIIAKMKLLRYSSNYLKDIVLYYPTLNLKISTLMGVQSMSMSEYEQEISAFYKQRMLLVDIGSGMFVGKLYPARSYQHNAAEDNKSIAFIKALLSNDAVSDYLSAFSNNGSYPTAMINYMTGIVTFDNTTQKAINQGKLSLIVPNEAASAGVNWTLEGNYLIVSAHSSYGDCSFLKYLPLNEIFTVPRNFSVYQLVFILLSVPVLLIYSVILYRYVKYPIDQLVEAFRSIRGGNFNVRLQIRSPSREFSALIDDFNAMTAQLGALIKQVIQQEVYTQQIEFKQLQSQINPHFLYNSFFTLGHLIQEEDIPTATQLASYLGSYFQYVTRTGIADVPLREEYAHVKAYMQIQQMRFCNRLTIELSELPDEVADIHVPRIILQPILENSLEHGVKEKPENGIIRMAFIFRGDAFHIITEDNGEHLDDTVLEKLKNQLSGSEPLTETTGIINIHRRLQITFGKEYGIVVDRSTMGGLLVDMKIPIERKGNQPCNSTEC